MTSATNKTRMNNGGGHTRNRKPSHDHTTKPAKEYYNVKGAKVYNTIIKVAKHPPNQPTTAAASTQSDPRPK